MTARRSIPTRYNTTLFRSKLEADWARAFDAIGVTWEYEKEGVYFGDVFYLPDFWLPRSRQYVEVKGVFEPNDCRKIQALLAHADPRPYTDSTAAPDEVRWCPDISIVACEPDGVFRGWVRGQTQHLSMFEFLTRHVIATTLFGCVKCDGWWFADGDQSFQCQCCGAYDGDHYLKDSFDSPLPGFPEAVRLHFP